MLGKNVYDSNILYKTLIIRDFDTIFISGCHLSMLFNIVGLMNKFLSLRGIFLNEKLLIFESVYQGFDFSYWRFIKTHYNFLLLNISSNFLRKYKLKLKLIVKNNCSKSVIDLIFLLNKQISDWIVFCSSVPNFNSICFSMDFFLYKLLWKWARRRHPRRPNTWIYSKYWRLVDGKWNFFVLDSSTGQFLFLKSHFSFSSKVYHLPFSLNVFSSLNENKFNSLFFRKFSYKLSGIYYYLWKKQFGLCASCKKFLFINDFSSLKLFYCSSITDDKFYHGVSSFLLLHKFCSYKF